MAIPPVSDGLAARTPGLRLLQVDVVARHGSRTPYKLYSPTCWDGCVRACVRGRIGGLTKGLGGVESTN